MVERLLRARECLSSAGNAQISLLLYLVLCKLIIYSELELHW